MSLSSQPSQNKPKLSSSHLPVSTIRPVPALDKSRVPSPAPARPKPSEPAEPRTPTAPSAAAPQAKQHAEAPKPKARENNTASDTQLKDAPAAEPVTEPARKPDTDPADKAAARSEAKKRWQEGLLDGLLVTLVVAVLAGGGYYLKTQRDQYRVPGIIEQTNEQCIELCKKREEIQDEANHADEQLAMRRKLAALEDKLHQFSEEAATRTATISEQQNRILALQHEIRRADKDARNVARGLLPGLYVGEVTTTRGKVYTDATISRIEGKRITLRTPYGAASMPISELVKDNLPDIALYALGMVDLVDMRDFTTDGNAPTSFKPTSSRLRPQNTAPRRTTKDYEPTPTGPVVDTFQNY